LDTRPAVFVGSSTEGLDIARAVQDDLKRDAIITIWNQARFPMNESVLETLCKSVQDYDFGIFIFTPDDKVMARGNWSDGPRDNVVFELGLYMGGLGRDRALVVCPSDIKMPSDWRGITVAHYDAALRKTNPKVAVASACNEIRDYMSVLGPRKHPATNLAQYIVGAGDKLSTSPYQFESVVKDARQNILITGQTLDYLTRGRHEPTMRTALMEELSRRDLTVEMLICDIDSDETVQAWRALTGNRHKRYLEESSHMFQIWMDQAETGSLGVWVTGER
jgi:hypothetical protein